MSLGDKALTAIATIVALAAGAQAQAKDIVIGGALCLTGVQAPFATPW